MQPLRLLLGVSLFWLPLSMVFDGFTALVLPARLLGETDPAVRATTLGLLTFTGLAIALVVQPLAGALSDRLRPRYGRRVVLAAGALALLAALTYFGVAPGLAGLAIGYLLIQGTASIAQAAFQGYLPDAVPKRRRGIAAGLRGTMDLAGALLAFVLLSELLAAGQLGSALFVVGATVLTTLLLTLALVQERPHGVGNVPLLPGLATFRLDLAQHSAFARVVAARFLFLLATYATGRFLLLFVAERLGIAADEATQQAGMLLASLTLLTALAAPAMGWAADRWGRVTLMLGGGALSAFGALLLIGAATSSALLLFGSLLALGSAAFSAANWAMAADLAPPVEAGRFLGLANAATMGAAAVAGLLGPMIDAGNAIAPGLGWTALFSVSAAAFLGSGLPLLTQGVAGVQRLGEGPFHLAGGTTDSR